MTNTRRSSCLVKVDNAELYAETFGRGDPFVMIHAGVADSRQWNHEFEFFAATHRVHPLRHARLWPQRTGRR